ncbi:hypothetical protein E3G68_005198 [Mycobacteroides abscessus]|uniref:hypothetical protein n=1 Tax=Mycobacteroides abscessus TaxID=36809 RepID=UPI001878B9D4|nr:hypothetical protein [Mycobacteroides abscessus]
MSAVHHESRSTEAVDAALAVRTLTLAQSALALARENAVAFSKATDVPHAELRALIALIERTIAATAVFPDLPSRHRQAGSVVSADLKALLVRLVELSR